MSVCSYVTGDRLKGFYYIWYETCDAGGFSKLMLLTDAEICEAGRFSPVRGNMIV
jgi:hypothetical protein